MASISVHFRNGDFIILGCTLEMANLAYNAIVNVDNDFVTLGVLDNWHRFAIRPADVIAAVVDPFDTATVYLSSAVVRSTELRSKIPQQPSLPTTAAEQPAATSPQVQVATPPAEQRPEDPQYRNGNDLIAAFVTHLVDSRIRLRALLRVLGTAVDANVLASAFQEINAQDRDALTQELFLTDESFQRRYADWIARQRPTPPEQE